MAIIQKIVRAGDLPVEWRKDFPDPEVVVRVLLRLVHEKHDDARQADRDISAVLDEASDQATSRGLTPALLDEIVNGR